MRNPNNYGCVTKLSGKRRRPYIARTPGRKIIGYYATREEAMFALADYNRNPYNVDIAKITFAELYKLWRDSIKMPPKTAANYDFAYKYATPLYTAVYRQIRAQMMRQTIEDATNENAKLRLLNLFRKLDAYATELDIITRPQSILVTAPPKPAQSTKHKPFTAEEIDRIKHCPLPNADMVLFMLYTGFRCGEMLALRPCDVNLDAQTLTGGEKTEAGRNRTIPIHPALLPIVARRVGSASPGGTLWPLPMSTFQKEYKKIMAATDNDSHSSHDCRHTVATALDRAGANKVCIDRILGHASSTIGERVYVHKTMDELRETILLLPY